MSIQKILQMCQQYGLTPKTLVARLSNGAAPKVVANSIPKSGTNLLIRALYLLSPMHRAFMRTLSVQEPGIVGDSLRRLSQGQFVPAHLKYSKGMEACFHEAGVRHILIVRDPRDIAVSNAICITHKDPSHRLHHYFTEQLKSDDERLMASIAGISGGRLADGIPCLLGYEQDLGW